MRKDIATTNTPKACSGAGLKPLGRPFEKLGSRGQRIGTCRSCHTVHSLYPNGTVWRHSVVRARAVA